MRVLVVEDEAALRGQLADGLTRAGYAVDSAPDGRCADFLGHTEDYDAIVLDLGLPGVDGLTVLRAWRDAGVSAPVLVLTARGSWSEKVQGIDAGADDYVAKPFSMEEVLARLRALIRRSAGRAHPQLRCGDIVLDPRNATVAVKGRAVTLTNHEFRVLSYLMHQHPRMVRWPTPTAGQNIRVEQAGCVYGLSQASFTVAAAGGPGSFNVVQESQPGTCGGPLQDRCVWTAKSDVSWITVTTSMPRTGDSAVAFTVAANAGSSRAGHVTVRDQVVTITQSSP